MTETAENKFKQVYKSEPGKPYETWFAPKDAEVKFPYVEEAPDPSFKTPMYDWNKYRWYDADGAVQGQQLGELKDQVQSLASQVEDGKLSQKEIDAINKQLGAIVGVLSTVTPTANTSTDKSTESKTGGDK